MKTGLPDSLVQRIKHLFPSAKEVNRSSVGGGCINETYKIVLSSEQLFCKINSVAEFPGLFVKEKNGLELIARQKIIKTPKVVDCFEAGSQQILLLEWINEGERTNGFWKKFGEQLASLHQVSNDSFGLNEDNYMGSVPQSNQLSNSWVEFFTTQRLQPLIKKCLSKKLLTPEHQTAFENLYNHLPFVFDEKQKPSLIHGDLWNGNFMCNQNSEPVLIDTAVYFGHPSIDLGMTTLFRGFHGSFYEAYDYYSPFSSNYKEQWEIGNLYPLLIHLYLFGRNYLPQIEHILKRFS